MTFSTLTRAARVGRSMGTHTVWFRVVVRLVTLIAPATLLCYSVSVRAQLAGTGTIQGSVSDSTGAVVTKAVVTLADQSTHVKQSAITDSAGLYVFPNIPIGTYSVSVASPGFKTYERSGIVLEVGSNIAVNVSMTAGAVTETVEVRSDSIALQTEDASFKQTIDEHAMTEMPLNGRLLTSLVNLGGGTVMNTPCVDCTGNKFPAQSVTVSIAGGGGNTTEWKLDGGDNIDYMGGGNLPFPFPDAVAQFSVESTALGAQDGMHSGGLVNVVTRSGTDQFHGSAFEFIRNNFLDATNFFATGKDTLHENQFGGTFGGPIIRRRLFAFAAYQREHDDSASSRTNAYIPTAANLAGDWSQTDPLPVSAGGTGPNACGPAHQLYDPITGAALPGNKYPGPPPYNAAALALQKYLPAIDPTLDPNNCGHVIFAVPVEHSENTFDTRVDYTINTKHNFYGRYFIDGYQLPPFYSPTNILITTSSGNIERVQSLTFGENWTINSNLVNSAHATGIRRQNTRGYAATDINAGTIGVTVFQTSSYGLQLSASTSGQNHGFTIGGGANSKAVINDNTFSFSDDVTYIHGKHQIVFGGEYVRNQLNLNNVYEGNGVFAFNGAYSGSGPTGNTGGTVVPGDANLDFLRGSMNSFQQSLPNQNALRSPIPSLYGQDTFHVNKKLTLVAGLRWQPDYLPRDYFNRGAVFNQSAFVANQVSTVYPQAPAGVFFYGDAGVPKQFTKNSPLQLVPNVGFSYDPFGTGKWALRGGYEFAYEQPDAFVGQRVNLDPPFGPILSPNTSQQICFSQPWLVGGTGYGCGQTGGADTDPFPIPPVPTPAQAVFFPQSQYIVYPEKYHAQDSSQWTASIQHQFGHGWQAQIDYIGSHTAHTLTALPLSPAVFTPGNWGAGGTGCGAVVTTGPAATAAKTPGAPGTPCSTTSNQIARFALTEANPSQGNAFSGGGSSLRIANVGWINYNGAIFTIQHRLSSTFSLLVNYTWSKCLNTNDAAAEGSGTTFENPSNISMDYGRCGGDERNIFNTTLVAKSEFRIQGIKGYLVNNWEFAPLLHINSGLPVNIAQGNDESLTDIGQDRANYVAGVNPYKFAKILSDHTGYNYTNQSYLNQAAFVKNAIPGTYGNIGRNAYSGPMYFQFDGQISRIFPIHERYNLDLRLEAFNVLNHPSFSNPSSSGPTVGSGASFGGITNTSVGARVFQGAVKVSF